MSYTKEELDAIFAKGDKIRGKDPERYRKDSCGNEIYRQSYGKESPMGWEVDHKKKQKQTEAVTAAETCNHYKAVRMPAKELSICTRRSKFLLSIWSQESCQTSGSLFSLKYALPLP